MPSRLLRNALVLGLLSAIGPFAIDMYLPALPAIGGSLAAGTAAVQASLMVFFAALGICQLVYGPVSDMVGRKPPLYAGLVLFAAGSVGCALAPDIGTLIAFRILQGVGACAGMVIPRAVVRDLHTGVEATRLMSLLMLVFSVSPILAPLSGSLVIALVGWRGVFWTVLVAGLLGLLLVAFLLPETRPAAARVESSLRGALIAYRILLADRTFLGLTFIGAFGISSFFTYLASSSFVLIDHYGLTPTVYSLFFSVNAVAFIGMAQLNGRLVARHGIRRLVRVAVTGFAAAMLLLALLVAAGIEHLAVLAGLLFVGYGFLGLVIPTTAVLALEAHGAIAGTASALLGTLQFVTGAVAIALLGLVADGTPLPMVAGIAACAVLTFVLAQGTLGGRKATAAARATTA
jgi:DHA1 family bicyclomycin/chloramphenicol resistance-like MFS transporter